MQWYSGGICSAPKKTPERKKAALSIKSMTCFVSRSRTCIDAAIMPIPCASRIAENMAIGSNSIVTVG